VQSSAPSTPVQAPAPTVVAVSGGS
jgi:hypothetical protein